MKNQEILGQVIKAQEGFTYEKVVDAEGYAVYLCKKPGTRIYAFEIIVGRYGIYLNGDISCLVWDVPRDIHFLAGNDVDYYIHSKLAAPFREKQEIDPGERDEFLVKEMISWLDENEAESPWSPMDLDENMPPLNIVADFFMSQGLDGIMKDCDVWNLYEEIHDSDDINHIYNEASKYDPDFCFDHYITRHDQHVTFCVYMACYAAQKIVEAGIA